MWFVFAILSGLATGVSWLCYYRAIQTAKVSQVVPIDGIRSYLDINCSINYYSFCNKFNAKNGNNFCSLDRKIGENVIWKIKIGED